jgi:hypothetical protein
MIHEWKKNNKKMNCKPKKHKKTKSTKTRNARKMTRKARQVVHLSVSGQAATEKREIKGMSRNVIS